MHCSAQLAFRGMSKPTLWTCRLMALIFSGEKADSALECFKESRATAKFLGLSTHQPHSSFRPFRGFSRGVTRSQYSSHTQGQQNQQSFCGCGRGSHRGRRPSQCTVQSPPSRPPQPQNPLRVPDNHQHPVEGRISRHLHRWESITLDN